KPMASITIRQLDDDLKQRLRLRAARNGRSMEDEARTILREIGLAEAGASATAPAAKDPTRSPHAELATDAIHILLIVSGGIAAYKSLDLLRRLKERGLAVRCVLTAAAQQFI